MIVLLVISIAAKELCAIRLDALTCVVRHVCVEIEPWWLWLEGCQYHEFSVEEGQVGAEGSGRG